MSAIEEKKYLTDKYAASERMTAADLRMITALDARERSRKLHRGNV